MFWDYMENQGHKEFMDKQDFNGTHIGENAIEFDPLTGKQMRPDWNILSVLEEELLYLAREQDIEWWRFMFYGCQGAVTNCDHIRRKQQHTYYVPQGHIVKIDEDTGRPVNFIYDIYQDVYVPVGDITVIYQDFNGEHYRHGGSIKQETIFYQGDHASLDDKHYQPDLWEDRFSEEFKPHSVVYHDAKNTFIHDVHQKMLDLDDTL